MKLMNAQRQATSKPSEAKARIFIESLRHGLSRALPEPFIR